MREADEAYASAQRVIAAAAKDGRPKLSLNILDYSALAQIPPEIASLTMVRNLDLRNTKVTDIAPLAGMIRIQNLYLNSSQITNLAPLAGMLGMQELWLRDTQITDLAPIAGMVGMKCLWLNRNQITDLTPLAGMIGMRELWLTSTKITNLAPLAEMLGMQRLWLDRTPITDLAPLAGMFGMQDLSLDRTQITDLAPLAGMVGMQSLSLDGTPITDLAPLAGMVGMQRLRLDRTQVTNLAPLARMVGLQHLWLDRTKITDLAPLAGMVGMKDLDLSGSQVADLRPIMGLERLGTAGAPGLAFTYTPATARDARLAELAKIKDTEQRARETLAYLRSLPPYPQPYLPAATPDGSPPQWIGDDVDAQAQAISDALPLDEDIEQDPQTGKFIIHPRAIAKPDLLAATCARIADALEDVLARPQNGLNDTALELRKLRRALTRFANDPQRLEMDFHDVHTNLMRKMAGTGELPPSDENIALADALREGGQGIRATHANIADNRRILDAQRLREMGPALADAVQEAAPVLDAITQDMANEQMAEDVAELIEAIRAPRLPGVTRADSILGAGAGERVSGRTARFLIMLRKGGDLTLKIHASTG